MKKLLYLFGILLVLNSCGGSKKTVEKKATAKTEHKKTPPKETNPNKDTKGLDFATLQYIAKYEKIAKTEMKEYGVPASITLAQGILESQSGKSRLATEGNNHFGIKCHNNWTGEKILHDDNKAQECFRKYNNPEESFKDHSQFLAKRKRYAFLFRLPITDYEAWARGLKKAGYATDPTYPDKLIYIIEKYHLNKMDREVLALMSVKVDETEEDGANKNKKKKFIYTVQEGETLFTISRKFNIPVKDIQRINNLNDFDIYKGQILVLTETDNSSSVQDEEMAGEDTSQPDTSSQETQQADTTTENTGSVQPDNNTTGKNNKDVKLHMVKQGETLFSISKKYKVSIDDLRRANQLLDNSISVGKVIIIPKNSGTAKEEVVEKKTEQAKPSPDNSKAVYHIVKPGETLYRIHVNYKVPIATLRKLNHLKGNSIKVGQKIRVK